MTEIFQKEILRVSYRAHCFACQGLLACHFPDKKSSTLVVLTARPIIVKPSGKRNAFFRNIDKAGYQL